jgi:hypothetical protein
MPVPFRSDFDAYALREIARNGAVRSSSGYEFPLVLGLITLLIAFRGGGECSVNRWMKRGVVRRILGGAGLARAPSERQSHRSAAASESSGCELKANLARGAISWSAFMTRSNFSAMGGRVRRPAPTTITS